MDWGPNKTGLDTSVPQQPFGGEAHFMTFYILLNVKLDYKMLCCAFIYSSERVHILQTCHMKGMPTWKIELIKLQLRDVVVARMVFSLRIRLCRQVASANPPIMHLKLWESFIFEKVHAIHCGKVIPNTTVLMILKKKATAKALIWVVKL